MPAWPPWLQTTQGDSACPAGLKLSQTSTSIISFSNKEVESAWAIAQHVDVQSKMEYNQGAISKFPGRGGWSFCRRFFFISTRLGGALKMSNCMTYDSLYRTVIEVNYLSHTGSTQIIY